MADLTRPLNFQEVQTAWELARSSDSFFKEMSIQDYSRFMNQNLGTTAYSAGDVGTVGGAVKNFSTGLDMSLAPVSEKTGDVGASLGRLIGPTAEKVGREVGQGLPRTVADAGLVLGGIAAAPVTGGASLAATAGGVMDTGAKTYTDTGSPAAGVLSGASQLLIPGAGGVGAKMGARVAAPLAERVAGTGVGDVLGGLIKAGGEYVGSTAAMTATGEAVNQGVSKLATGEFYNPFETENIARTIAGVLPFAAWDAQRFVKTTRQFARETPIRRDVAGLAAQEARLQPSIESLSAPEAQEFAKTRTLEQLHGELTAKTQEIAALPKAATLEELDAQAPVKQQAAFLREAIRIQESAAAEQSTLDLPTAAKSKVGQSLAGLEADGVPAEQMLRATPRIAESVRANETPESAAFRQSGFVEMLGKPASPDELMASSQRYFSKLYESRGETPERVSMLTRQAMIVAARFRGVDDVTMMRALPRQPGEEVQASFASAPIGEEHRRFVGVLGETAWKTWETEKGKDALEHFTNLRVLGHELMHSVQLMAQNTPEGIATMRDAKLADPNRLRAYHIAFADASQLTAGQKAKAMTALWKEIVPEKVFKSDGMQKYLSVRESQYDDRVIGTHEFLADFAGLAAAQSPKSMGNATLLYGSPTLGFLRGLYADIASVFSGVRSMFEQIGDRRSAKALESVHENVRKILKTVEEAEQTVDAFLALGQREGARAFEEPPALSYEEMQRVTNLFEWNERTGARDIPMDDETAALVRDAAELVVPKRELGGKRMSAWDYLTPMVQLAQKYPMLKPVVWLANAQRAMVSQNTIELWKPFANEKGKIDHKLLRKVGMTDTPLNRLFNKVALAQNTEEKTIWSRDEIISRFPEFRSLAEPDQKALLEALPKFGQVAQAAAIMRVKMHRAEVEHAMARILQAQDRAMTFEEALKYGQKAVKAVWDAGTDDVGSTTAEADLRSMGMSGAVIDRVLDAARANLEVNGRISKQLLGEDGQGKPHYFPEVRLGDWFLAWQTKDGKPQVVGYKTKAEANAKFVELQKDQALGRLKYLRDWNKADKNERYAGLNAELIDVYKEADQRLYDSVLAAVAETGDADTINAIREEFQPGAGTTVVSTSPYMLERRLVGGRETLNMVEGMLHYINATSNGLAKRFVKTRQAVTLQDPSLRANPNIQNFAKRYLQSVIDPPARELTTLKNLVFWNYMGLNPSSLPIELAQQASTLVPHLVDKGETAIGAYGRLASAWKDIAKARKTGRYDDPELDAAVARARAERTVDTGIAQELYAAEDVDFVNTRNLLTGGGSAAVEAKDLLNKAGYMTLKFARDFYGLATTFNSETAFVASYRFAREKLNLRPQEAEVFAKDATYTTMFSGGTTNRPAFAYGLGKTQGIVGLALSLQSYTLNSLAFFARQSRKAVMDSALSPAEKLAARKSMALMFGTQAVLGGAMGLPLVGGALAIIDEVFPEAQTKKNLRAAFFGLIDDDTQMGHIIADGAMNGLFNTLPGGPDIGARFQLGSLMGVSPYDGFSWKNLAGPAASMLENYTKAGKNLLAGDLAGAVTDAVPAGLKGAVRLVADDGAVKDRQGRLLFEATAAEKVMLATGFKPKRYNQAMEQQKMVLQSERAADADSTRFHNLVADALQAGDTKTVQQLLYTRQGQQPGYDVQAGIRRAADIVQQRVTPQDPTRGASLANSQDVSQIARMYPRGTGPSEVQKLHSSWALQSASGIPVRPPSNQAFSQAAMLDALMQSNPSLTRAQAVAILARMSPSGARSSFMRYGPSGPVPLQ
jgi:hypothetical protein